MKHRLRSILLPLLAAAIWGMAFVAQDVCAGSVPPLSFNAIRFFIAVVFLSLVKLVSASIKARRREKPRGEAANAENKGGAGGSGGFKTIIIAGALCGAALAVASWLQQAGLEAGTDSGKAGFITALYVVLVPIGGLFLKKRFPKVFWAGLALAVVGLYLLCVNKSFTLYPGDLLLLLCAAAFAAQILLIDRFAGSLDPIAFCIAEFAFAAALSAAAAAFTETPDWAKVFEHALPILYVAIFSCGIAYLLQIIAQREGDPAIVSLLFSMESVFAVIGGAIILSQRMTAREYAGCALILIAVIVAQLPERRSA